MTKYRRAATAAASSSSGGGGGPASFVQSYAPFTNSNSFGTSTTATQALDISAHSAVTGRALVIHLAWYANGGGALTFLCEIDGVSLTMMIGDTVVNVGAQLWIVQNPPLTGTMTVRQTGGSNTGRNIWASASLYGGVNTWGGVLLSESQANGTAHNITIADGEMAVNTMASVSAISAYSQTQDQNSSVASNLRGASGHASGAGVKGFSSTGNNFSSALAKLIGAAA